MTITEESIWNDASRELSRLILSGYTIEDICDELSIDPLIIHVLNATVPLAYETTKILKELEHVKRLLKKYIKPSEPEDDIVKGKQLHLMAKNLISLRDVKTYAKEYAVSWTPDEDEVLCYLEKRGLSATYIPLLFPRTRSSIIQRYRAIRINSDIGYRSRSYKPRKYTKVFKEKRGINMSNINTMLTSLSETVFSMLASGKTLDEISTELGVDKIWLNLIIESRDSVDEMIYNVIVNDKTFEINSKNDLINKTQLNIDQINVSIARLLSQHRLPYATLWKRQLLPPTINKFHENPDYFYKEYMDGCSLEYLSYITKVNPDTFRRMLATYRDEKNLTNRTDAEGDKKFNQVFSRNRSLLNYIKFIEFHFEDLSKDMSDISEAIFHNNLEKLKAELVECYEDGQPVVTAEPQEYTSVKDTADEHVEKFNDIIDEPDLEAMKDTEDSSEYQGLIEQPIEEPKPKCGLPSYLRRKDEWTDRELEILKSMVLNGDDLYEISNHPDMHRTLGAIRRRIDRLRANGELPKEGKKERPKKTKEKKYTRQEWTTTEETKLIEMHLAGNTVSDIAKALVRSKGSVSVRIHKLRVEGSLPEGDPEITSRFKPVWTDEEIKTIKRMIKEGARTKDIFPHLPNKNRTQVNNKISDMRRTGKL